MESNPDGITELCLNISEVSAEKIVCYKRMAFCYQNRELHESFCVAFKQLNLFSNTKTKAESIHCYFGLEFVVLNIELVRRKI
jgi:hypothetical protein